jgi:hypothetical protein
VITDRNRVALDGLGMAATSRRTLTSNGASSCAFNVRFHSEGDWFLLTLPVIAPAFLLMATLWLPESPRWLIAQGKDSQGLRILKKLHHKEEDPRDIFAREEFMQIEQQLELESTQARTLWAMVKVPSARRRLITGFLIQYELLHLIWMERS